LTAKLKFGNAGREDRRAALTTNRYGVSRRSPLPFFISTFCFLYFCFSASASTNLITFDFYNSLQVPLSNMTVTLAPIVGQLGTNGFVDTQPLTEITTNSGAFLVTNLQPGSYMVHSAYSFTEITVPTSNFTNDWTNLISGILAPGASAVYTRAQADARYFQSTNAQVVAMLSSNTTFLGWIQFNGTTIISNGFFLMPTNYSEMVSNATLLGTINQAGATNENGIFLNPITESEIASNLTLPSVVDYPSATNYATNTFSTNYTLTWSSIPPNASAEQTVAWPGVGTNCNWEITIVPRADVALSQTNLVFSAWVSATNTITVQAANASATVTEVLVAGPYRVTGRQWQ